MAIKPNKLPYCKSPCNNCPFRKDSLKGWLGKRRAQEIVNNDNFVCHKTTQTGNEKDRLQCAGHMILLDDENLFVRTARGMGILLTIVNRYVIFESKEDFIKHHDHERHNERD